MRIVVTGATGNVGTSVLAALGRDPQVDEIVGLARREPNLALPKVRWCQADVTSTPLPPIFEGADAVIHLAWAIQPSHDERAMERVNVESGGTGRARDDGPSRRRSWQAVTASEMAGPVGKGEGTGALRVPGRMRESRDRAAVTVPSQAIPLIEGSVFHGDTDPSATGRAATGRSVP